MADIFLSYAKEDREIARKLAALLEKSGWTVWWDRRIPAGRTWHDVLEDALREMRCMVVLWSSHSIDSDWVKEEAEEARALKKLLPVLIEPVTAPVGFRAIQAADLTDWDGVNESLGSRQLIVDLESLIGKPVARVTADERPRIRAEQNRNPQAAAHSLSSTTAPDLPQSQVVHRSAVSKSIHWKHVAAAAVVLVGAFGIFAFWPQAKTEKREAAVITTPPAPEPVAAPKIVKLGVFGPRSELKPAERMNLGLRGVFSDGSENEISSPAEWSSSDSRVAAVDNHGRVTALQAGTAAITASHGGVTSAAWSLSVQAPEPKPAPPPKLLGLAVIANKKDLMPREKIALRVAGTYSDGSKKNLSSGVLWNSSDTGVASVNGAGEVEAWRAGRTEVVARVGEVASAPVWLAVREPVPTRVTEPEERKAPEYAPAKSLTYATVEKAPEPPPAVVPEVHPEQLRAKVISYLSRAKDYRIRGDYRAALAELGNARATDPGNAEVRTEIEQTKRACLAEKRLGRSGLDCG